jgi:Fe-S oxidoreductase
MLQGDVITDGWRSEEVRDALDLCLACKGCRSDCPVNVDMATYKAEFLSHHYEHRIRPMAHYSMGWIPLWARLAGAMPRTVNAVMKPRPLAAALKAVGGIDAQRELPRFAEQSFVKGLGREHRDESRPTVLLWPDTFTNYFDPAIAVDAMTVLDAAGFDVQVPRQAMCCGLTWISTGQLATAKRVLRRTLKLLRPALRSDIPVVVLEPSCAAVFRSDLPELLEGNEDAHRLAGQTVTIGELLTRRAPHWRPKSLDSTAVVQQHCHQHAILHYIDELQSLDEAGVDAHVLDAGCCGLAGNFGFERGHYDVSVACAQDKLLPALAEADPDSVVIADGFSCRTQIRELSDRRPQHTVQVLARAVQGR